MPYIGNFPTSLKRVEPGDITGDYYIIFSSLPFKTTWQEIKDWVSASCPVDFVEVFPTSTSGWIRLKGKDHFMTALAHMRGEHFKNRRLIVNSRNETQSVDIRVRAINPTPSRSYRRSSFTRGNRGHGETSRQIQSPYEASMPRPCGTHSVAWSETDAVDLIDATAGLENDDLLAFANFMLGMNLQSTLQMGHYALPLAFPFYNWGFYDSMGSVNYFPYYYGGDYQEESDVPDDESQNSD